MSTQSKSGKSTIVIPSSGNDIERAELPPEFLGKPGRYAELSILARYESGHRCEDERLADRELRPFKVSAILGKTHLSVDPTLPHVAPGLGESFILGPDGCTDLMIELEGNEYVFRKNYAGEFSYIECTLKAVHHKIAHNIFYYGLAKFLDFLSYMGAFPVCVKAVRIEDLHNGHIVLPHVSPFHHVEISLGETVLYPELSEIYALYREGINSGSDFYKLLCFFKIGEGLIKFVRPAIVEMSRRKGFEIEVRKLQIPEDKYLTKDQHKYIGWGVQQYIEQVLTKSYRDGIAHFGLKDGSVKHLSSPEERERYAHEVYLAELCVRIMIQDCERLLGCIYGSPHQNKSA